jgi:hypothetical protein
VLPHHDRIFSPTPRAQGRWEGAQSFFINGAESVLNRPTAEAIAAEYPGVPIDVAYFQARLCFF